MKSSVEKLNDTRVKLTVEVPFEELNNEIDKAYKALAAQVNIPGFRKGKAPRKLIDARFGRGPVLEQVINDMLPVRYQQAVADNDLAVIGQPDVDVTKMEDGELIEFTAEVDIRPEISLPDFSAMSVEVPALSDNAAEEAVEAEIDRLRERFGELSDTRRKLKTNDFAIINLVASVDGKEIEESKADDLTYQVGQGDLIDGLDTALRGLKTGEEAEFTTTLNIAEYKDQEATVKVTVVQTKERKLPELNDEFVQEASEFDTVDELRESTASQVDDRLKAEQASAIRDAVLEAALKQSEFPLPESLVKEQAENALRGTFGEAASNEAVIDEYLKSQGSSLEQFKAEAHENAEKNVRNQLFLDVLAEQENPEVSQSELTDHILFTAQAYGMDPNQFVQSLQQAGQIGALFADVKRGKALAAAICRVTVTDDSGASINPEDYFGLEDEPEEEEN
ncbi:MULTISPECIES: trigger factor [unclassified Corynebacterium]|uniref:trigger factor n=1 Tax=unclassified Corynebacterium TaxID=2624378 RepID=UPI002167623A|nr:MULTISPECIES: trigger factor [unclassified Corynebacterium]MCS4490690.1 trigger factor [Corynebacterium sp. ES2775-CONJ]MCS4492492.1 trigger factor [Corynebacterium sp. ES2715-CONJ3]MCS4532544.1 trigger factor [Corynebacterium sp. ES2730-CONJ]